MQIHENDFPSDINGESYELRKELTKCLQRSCTSETGMAVLKDIVKFGIAKIKEAEAELKAFIKVRDYVEPVVEPEVAVVTPE